MTMERKAMLLYRSESRFQLEVNGSWRRYLSGCAGNLGIVGGDAPGERGDSMPMAEAVLDIVDVCVRSVRTPRRECPPTSVGWWCYYAIAESSAMMMNQR